MKNKTIVLGVSGGIAAYKACELASRLTQGGARVPVVMTSGAQKFVQPITFAALTHEPVYTSLWPQNFDGARDQYNAMAHIKLADEADAIIVAPASANCIARLAHGLSDDLLSTLILATRAPILISPAMNPQMLSHAATQKNLQTLREIGYQIIEPDSGRMACEHVGSGRLPETDVLISHLRAVLEGHIEYSQRDLEGKTVLITAGPTREALDPVRFLSNRSSGKMGYALAEVAAKRGANVILVSGPTPLAPPPGVTRIDVLSTQEMFDAATKHASSCDVVIAAAAPADFRPARYQKQKIKKGDASTQIVLEPTPDIVAHLAQNKRAHQIIIGFAAETGDGRSEAQRKLHTKNLDAIVLNDVTEVGAGFEGDTNRVTWITSGATEAWPLLSKREVSTRILNKIKEIW
jgi:phosphopantothenoylcysteine decarboxylase / phosphopantothenate---cysteine ligase